MTPAYASAAAARIGCTAAEYLAQRIAGERWCSVCRTWQRRVHHHECYACRVVLDRARKKRPERRPREAVLAAYAASTDVRQMATRLGCSVQTVRRDMVRYDLRPFGERTPQHPPARWCSCAVCRVARGAA